MEPLTLRQVIPFFGNTRVGLANRLGCTKQNLNRFGIDDPLSPKLIQRIKYDIAPLLKNHTDSQKAKSS